MSFQLPKIPYEQTALSPTISKETMDFHFGKHHKAYIDNLNKLLEDSPLKSATLEEIVNKSSGGMFNNAAQAWNHTFYWYCISPNSQDYKPSDNLDKELTKSFGGKDKFLEQFSASAMGNFGSGWTWLVKDSSGKLSIVNTSNADTPITKGLIPLLTVDVWEHAYYIDYRNARKGYLDAFFKSLNWKFASERFDANEVFNCTAVMK
ncbi:MAG: superoxide dismutase [Oligoflexia bacterium]|nr:superoxide dismutase [Oligoflexia bacterium]